MPEDLEDVTEDSSALDENTTDDAGSEPAPDLEDGGQEILDILSNHVHDEDEEAEPEEVEAEDDVEEPDVTDVDDEPAANETNDEAVEDEDETEDTETTEPEDSTDDDEAENHIPYTRFKQVNDEKNELKGKAQQWEQFTKSYQDAGINDESMRTWSELGVTIATNPDAAYDSIVAMCSAVGLEVVQAVPDDVKQMLANGEITEEAAARVAQRPRAAVAQPQQTMPSFAEPVFDVTTAIDEINLRYDTDYKDVFSVEANIKAAGAAIARRMDEYLSTYGHEMPDSARPAVQEAAFKEVVKSARTTKRKPRAVVPKPLRPRAAVKSPGSGSGSVRDFVKSNEFLKNI